LVFVLGVLVLSFGSARAGALDGYKEFVAEDSQQVPEIKSIWDVLGVDSKSLDEQSLSSKNDGKYDYLAQTYNACKFDEVVRKCSEEVYVLVLFYTLTPVKDGEDNDQYNKEVIALVFTGPKIAWFKSQEARQAFQTIVLDETGN
ncbi:MAG: hypothetical protein Q7S12_03890, partial [bacterium]|nr:hypothetical protein [bacterium]